MKQAVQFGAGNIGRGFLGQLFFESGYATTFIDVADELVAALNARGEYPLRVVDEHAATLRIRHVRALHSTQSDEVARAVAAADLAATAVGVSALPGVAPLIARGIEQRLSDPTAPPLNIIVCENLLDAGPYLRAEVRRHLPELLHRALESRVGFVEASIGRMVPMITDAMRAEDPLLVCVEAYCELPVDAQGFRGPIPELQHMQPRPNFGAYVERKLFVHNAGHAATAYLGHLRGHEFIWQAIGDPLVRAEVDAAMSEACEGLARRHGLDPAEVRAHAADLVRRFANRALGDQIARVARDPVRKLGPRDRLIGAAVMCLEQGVMPEHLAFAAAAAIRYDDPNDEAARLVRRVLNERGLDGVLTEICGLEPGSPLRPLIATGMARLRAEGWTR